MDALQTSWINSALWPKNLIDADKLPVFQRRTYHELEAQTQRVFCTDGEATIDIVERYADQADFSTLSCRSVSDLRGILWKPVVNGTRDPLLRVVHIQAPDSRSHLRITLPMLKLLCTYHQIPSAILRGLLTFGAREYAQECVLNTFDQRDDLIVNHKITVPQLGRTGRQMQHSYSLRSVEKATSDHWPWAIRQCTAHHCLDLDSGQALWVFIKANTLVKKLLEDLLQSNGQGGRQHPDNLQEALLVAMEMHARIAQWSADNWHLYLTYIEGQLQLSSRHALFVTLGDEEKRVLSPRTTGLVNEARATGSGDDIVPGGLNRVISQLSTYARSFVSRRIFSFQPEITPDPEPYLPVSSRQFSFKDLPRTYFLEERITEARDTLQNNIHILRRLSQAYELIIDETVPANTLSASLEAAVERFRRTISCAIETSSIDSERATSMLHLATSRRALMTQIFDYSAMKANQSLAENAHESSIRMQSLTEKSKHDMVSVRIITVITLFFLPGTFICTMMSTPIVTFQEGASFIGHADISWSALTLFLTISLPMLTLVFMLWFVLNWLEKRRERQAVVKSHMKKNEMV